MRKTLCTASIFTALMGALVAGFWIQVPNDCWWLPALEGAGTIPLIVWISINVAPGFLVLILGFGMWCSADALCTTLRARFGKGYGDGK